MIEINSQHPTSINSFDCAITEKKRRSEEDNKVNCLVILRGLLVLCAGASIIGIGFLAATVTPLIAIAIPITLVLTIVALYLSVYGQEEEVVKVEPKHTHKKHYPPYRPKKLPELKDFENQEKWREECIKKRFLDKAAPPIGKNFELWKQLCIESGFLIRNPALRAWTPLKVPVALLDANNFKEWKEFCVAAEFIGKETPDWIGTSMKEWIDLYVPKSAPEKLYPKSFWDYSFAPRPQEYIEGQPIGLLNFINDCWLNTTLQFFINVPEYLAIIEQEDFKEEFKLLLEFKAQYETAETAKTSVLSAKTREIRSWLKEHNRIDKDFSLSSQEDPFTAFFEYFFRETGYHLPIEEKVIQIDGDTDGFIPKEDTLWIDLHVSFESGFSFQDNFFAFLNAETDTGEQKIRRFTEAPKSFLINLRRSDFIITDVPTIKSKTKKQSKRKSKVEKPTKTPPTAEKRAEFFKISTPVAIPKEVTLTENFFMEGTPIENPHYECTAFMRHIGESYNSGHYVAFIYRKGQWWRCNDSIVTRVAADAIETEMGKSDYFYYSRKQTA